MPGLHCVPDVGEIAAFRPRSGGDSLSNRFSAKFPVEVGIDTISVTPDSVADVLHHVAEAEKGA